MYNQYQYLQRRTGRVCFRSDPGGAEIYVDGMILVHPETEEAVRTPACVDLPEGRRDIVYSTPQGEHSFYVHVIPGTKSNVFRKAVMMQSNHQILSVQPIMSTQTAQTEDYLKLFVVSVLSSLTVMYLTEKKQK